MEVSIIYERIIPMSSLPVSVIPLEHERRFFPDLKTFSFNTSLYQKVYIVQGYLEDDLRTRIRDEVDECGVHRYLLTRKTGGGISRTEHEIEITKDVFESMWRLVRVHLTKRRYFVPIFSGEYIAEVNFFEGPLQGYIQVEVEFKSHEEAVAFVPLRWFGKEVTEEKEHGNYYLAKHGCKKLLSLG